MLVLFDIDDTLLDHRGAERQAATRLCRNFSPSGSLDQFLERWSASLDIHFARYLAGEVSYQEQRRNRVRDVIDASLSDEAADRLFSQYLADYEVAWSLFADVHPCLDNLSQHRLGIISNGQGTHQRRKLAQTGILDRFECVLISEECGCAKPDRSIFIRACTDLGESPANCVYVGDRYDIDAEGARSAGLTGIWLDRANRATEEHAPPIITSLDQMPQLLAPR